MFDFENTPIEKDTNLIAQWGGDCAGFSVKFDLDDGISDVPIPTQIVPAGQTATMPTATPSKDGCGFIGWYEKTAEDPDPQPEPGAGGTVNVMFRVDGGSPQPAGQEIVAGTIAQYPGAVEKEGCEFLGWYLAGEMPDELVSYLVTFDTDGGNDILPVSVWSGQAVMAPTDPTKEGFEFNGWTLGGEPYDMSTPVTSDITLVASWMEPEFVLPDLSQPLDGGGLTEIRKIITAGKAQDYLKVGDDLLFELSNLNIAGTMRLRVVGFEPKIHHLENGEDIEVSTINLFTKDAFGGQSPLFNLRTQIYYSESYLRETIYGSWYSEKMPSYLLDGLANTKVQMLARDGEIDISYNKFYAPSVAELGLNPGDLYYTAQQIEAEGPALPGFVDDNSRKVRPWNNQFDIGTSYWTRSYYYIEPNYAQINSDGKPDYNDYDALASIGTLCNLMGFLPAKETE